MMIDATATIRGLTIGNEPYVWTSEPQGLLSTAPIRVDDRDPPNRDGLVAGGDFLRGKLLTFEVAIIGSTPTEVEQLASDLESAFATSRVDMPLDARATGTPSEYRFFGRPRGADVVLGRPNELFGNSVGYAQCRFMATDPVRYGAEMSQVIGLSSHVLPQTLPFIVGYHDSETIANPGNSSVDRWTLEFEAVDGDLVDPSIAHAGLGQLIFHDLTLAEGETLLVDGQERRALLNGVTPVVPTIAQWWKIQPANNTIRFAAGTASSLTSTATLTWRPGWGGRNDS